MTLLVPPTNNSDETARQFHPSHQSPFHQQHGNPAALDSDNSLDPIDHRDEETKISSVRILPSWVKEQLPNWGERVCLPEWDDDDGGGFLNSCGDDAEYRSKNGWQGSDLCHSEQSPVRISHYAIQYGQRKSNDGDIVKGGVGTTLTGIAHFTRAAESHAGFCHGGSMTSVMDDVIGWTAFFVTGSCLPWSGFTAQINVSLQRPIAVGSFLKIVGTITRWEGRKVWIEARLLVGEENGESEVVHCTADGLVILKRECIQS